MRQDSTELTQYLKDWRDGDKTAFDQILPLVYDELRKIARYYRQKERRDHTLQTSDIINEAYLKLISQNTNDWQDREHFFAVASKVMRNLLVDHARKRNFQKRGGNFEKIDIENVAIFAPNPDEKIIALDEALKVLAKLDERKSTIVELRYFGGLSALETAEVLGISEITVKREWLKAKAWLYKEMS